jgi:NAD(P)-dependent dehydrogenase (short-subunit alcohol dehydrogenase family)
MALNEVAVNKTAVVTGAGSGVGRAVAVHLAQEGWSVALVGRTAASLNETRTLAGPFADQLFVTPCDVSDPKSVADMAAEALQELGGTVGALVNSAGTNIPRRAMDVLSVEDFRRLVDINLNGTFYCIHAFLPHMRDRGGGTIVNIVSDAGLWGANPKAGTAYVASKFGVTGLTEALNAEERGRGVRACAVFPGDIDTPLLEKRPAPPSPEARQRMLQPEDVAECVLLAINLPPRAVVEQLVIRPR